MAKVIVTTEDESVTVMTTVIVENGDETPGKRTTEEIPPYGAATFDVTPYQRLSIRYNPVAEPGADIEAPIT